jgi:TRAP-type C4-dicarboxylate transport system substrate-binding protein
MKRLLFGAAVMIALSTASVSNGNAQDLRLFFTSMSPANSANSKFFNAWARKVEAAAGNAVKIDVKDGFGTLGTLFNIVQRVRDDVAQIGWTIHSFHRGRYALSQVAGLPFVADESVLSSVAMWRLWETGLLKSEYKDIVPIWFGRSGTSHIHFSKPPKSIDNLKGVKVRVGGVMNVAMVKALGMSPQSIAPQDIYVALQRGTIDATVLTFSGFPPYKLHEVTGYHLLANLGSITFMHFLARKKFDGLPAKVRNAIMRHSGEAGSRAWGEFLEGVVQSARKTVRDLGHPMVELTAAQNAEWRATVAKPIIDKWIADNSKGAEVLATYKKIYSDLKRGK